MPDTTTFAAIRDQVRSVVEALTPTIRSDRKFTFAGARREFADFKAYAEQHPDACTRWFAYLPGPVEFPSCSNSQVELRKQDAQLAVAYANRFGIHHTGDGDVNLHELHDTCERDLHQIARAVGKHGGANRVAGQHAAVEYQMSVEPGDKVTYGLIDFTLHYYFDVSS